MVAKPLLSMRSTGSLDTERAVKPLKNAILTKNHNKLSDERAVILARASHNLMELVKYKSNLKKLAMPKPEAALKAPVHREPSSVVYLAMTVMMTMARSRSSLFPLSVMISMFGLRSSP